MSHATILIIEDNPMNMELASDLLLDEGFDVIGAEDAVKGIEMAKADHPDLILMDLQLPGLDGIQATHLLKEEASTRDIPVIALTAHAMSNHSAMAKEAGCIAFISKPIDVMQFPDQISELLEEAQSVAAG
jgi:CheY-like chemotaxis protein